MRFNTPPGWPTAPSHWIPETSWTPEADWPEAPAGWPYWVDDAGNRVAGPRGSFGARRERVVARRVGLGIAGAVLLLAGVAVGGSGAGSPAALVALPETTSTVTVPPSTTIVTTTATTTASVTAAPVTVTAPPVTVTAAPVVSTVTVTSDPIGSGASVPAGSGTAAPRGGAGAGGPAAATYYPNCSAARVAGAAPIYRGEPAYRPGLDGDDDGVACE